MVGFDKLTESQVSGLAIGTQVFIKLSGVGWTEDEREDEGFYHIGQGRKLWNSEGKQFFFIYEMNLPNYEFEVYIPSIRYQILNIIQNIKTIMRTYNITLDDVINKIRGGFNVS